MKWTVEKILFSLFCLFISNSSVNAADRALLFGIVPQQTPTELAEKWVPFIVRLNEKCGMNIRFATAPNIPEFEKRLAVGEYDLAYMNPYHFVVFNDKPGYISLANDKQNKIKGIIVVRQDSPITRISQLDGAEIVFPSPAAFAASILPRAALSKAGVKFSAKFVESHDSVYMNVTSGLSVAGGGIPRTLGMLEETIQEQLRVLWTTPSFTAHAIAAHPRIKESDRKEIQKCLVSIDHDADGSQLLSNIGFKSLAVATDSEWDDVRDLSLQELEHLR